MKKLNSVIYHKLLLQAKEAKTQEMHKLSSAVMGAIGPVPEDENVEYNHQQLKDELYEGMWKLAAHVVKYYDVRSLDINTMHDRLETLANQFLEEIESSLGVEDVVAGPLESLLPGEYKIVAHKKDHICPKCASATFCKDCGVCSGCEFCTKPEWMTGYIDN